VPHRAGPRTDRKMNNSSDEHSPRNSRQSENDYVPRRTITSLHLLRRGAHEPGYITADVGWSRGRVS